MDNAHAYDELIAVESSSNESSSDDDGQDEGEDLTSVSSNEQFQCTVNQLVEVDEQHQVCQSTEQADDEQNDGPTVVRIPATDQGPNGEGDTLEEDVDGSTSGNSSTITSPMSSSRSSWSKREDAFTEPIATDLIDLSDIQDLLNAVQLLDEDDDDTANGLNEAEAADRVNDDDYGATGGEISTTIAAATKANPQFWYNRSEDGDLSQDDDISFGPGGGSSGDGPLSYRSSRSDIASVDQSTVDGGNSLVLDLQLPITSRSDEQFEDEVGHEVRLTNPESQIPHVNDDSDVNVNVISVVPVLESNLDGEETVSKASGGSIENYISTTELTLPERGHDDGALYPVDDKPRLIASSSTVSARTEAEDATTENFSESILIDLSAGSPTGLHLQLLPPSSKPESSPPTPLTRSLPSAGLRQLASLESFVSSAMASSHEILNRSLGTYSANNKAESLVDDDVTSSANTWSSDADKNNLMFLLDNERRIGVLTGNEEKSRRFEQELSIVQQADLEELENVQVSVKCEISTALNRFNIKELNDLVAKTNEELMHLNLSRLQELRDELEKTYRIQLETISRNYHDQLAVLQTKLTDVTRQLERERTEAFTATVASPLEVEQSNSIRIAQLENELLQTRCSYEQLLESMQSRHAIEVDEIRKGEKRIAEATLADMRTRFDDEFAKLKRAHQETLTKQQDEVAVLLARLAEVEQSQLAATTELDAERSRTALRVEQLERDLIQMNSSRDEELSSMRLQYEEDIAQLRQSVVTNYVTDVIRCAVATQQTASNCHQEPNQQPLKTAAVAVQTSRLKPSCYSARCRERNVDRLKLQVATVETSELDAEELPFNETYTCVPDMTQLNGTITLVTRAGDAFDEADDVGSESDHQLRQYENHLRRMEQHNDDLEELRSQVEEKSVEVADLRQKVEKLQSSLHQRDDEVDQLRQQHQIDIDKISELESNVRELNLVISGNTSIPSHVQDGSRDETNQRLLRMLNNVMKLTITVDERIGDYFHCRLASVRGTVFKRRSPSPGSIVGHISPVTSLNDDTNTKSVSMTSLFTDEGLDLSRQLSDMADLDLDNDTEEFVNDVTERLQKSVDRLLITLADTTKQLEDATASNNELKAKLGGIDEKAQQLSSRCHELELEATRLTEERTQLLVEISHLQQSAADNNDERSDLFSDERRRSTLTGSEEDVAAAAERERLRQIDEQRANLEYREQLLLDQQKLLDETLNQQKQDSVTETIRLTNELAELRRHYDVERNKWESTNQKLDEQVYELKQKLTAAANEKRSVVNDYERRVEVLEKQIKSHKDFLEEQSQEREQERDEHQNQMQKLQQALQEQEREANNKQRIFREELERCNAEQLLKLIELDEVLKSLRTHESLLSKQVADLRDQLHERRETCDQLMMKNDEMETELKTAQKSIVELQAAKARLQSTLDDKVAQEKQHVQKILDLEEELARQQEIVARLTEELCGCKDNRRELNELRLIVKELESKLNASKGSEAQSKNRSRELESELLTLKGVEAEAQKKCRELQQNASRREIELEELQRDRETLQFQVNDQLTQIAQLKSQLDSMKIDSKDQLDGNASRIEQLTEKIEKSVTLVELKKKENAELISQLQLLQQQLIANEDKAQQTLRQQQQIVYNQDHEIHGLQQQLLRDQQTCEALKATVSTLRAELHNVTEARLQNCTEIENLRANLDSASRRIREKEQQLESGRARETELNVEIEQLRIELSKLKSDSLELNSRLQTDLNQTVDEYKRRLAESKAELSATKNVQRELEEKLSEARRNLVEQQKQAELLTSLLKQQKSKSDEEVETYQQRIKVLQDDRDREISRLQSEAENQRIKAERELESVNRSLVQKLADLKSAADQELESANESIKQHRQQIAELTQNLQGIKLSCDSEVEKYRAQLKMVKSENDRNTKKATADQLQEAMGLTSQFEKQLAQLAQPKSPDNGPNEVGDENVNQILDDNIVEYYTTVQALLQRLRDDCVKMMSSLNGEMMEFGDQLSSARRDANKFKNQLSTVKLELDAEKQLVSTLRAELGALRDRISQLEQFNVRLEAAVESGSARCKELHSSLQNECQRSLELQGMLNVERSGRDDASRRNEKTLTELTSRLEREIVRATDLETALCDEQRKLISCSGELERLRLDLGQQQHITKQIKSENEELERELDACRQRKLSAERKLDRVKKTTEAVQNDLKQHQSEDELEQIVRTKTTLGRKELLHMCQQAYLTLMRQRDYLKQNGLASRLKMDEWSKNSLNVLLEEICQLQSRLEHDSPDDVNILSTIIPELNAKVIRHNSVLTTLVTQLSRAQQELKDRLEQQRDFGTDSYRTTSLPRYSKVEADRTSLIYQKHYLLLLIGGFRDNETQVLRALAKMGAYPTITRRHILCCRFKVAALVVVASIRLQNGVYDWYKKRQTIPISLQVPTVTSVVSSHRGNLALPVARLKRTPSDSTYYRPVVVSGHRPAPSATFRNDSAVAKTGSDHHLNSRTNGSVAHAPSARNVTDSVTNRLFVSQQPDKMPSFDASFCRSITPSPRQLVGDRKQLSTPSHSLSPEVMRRRRSAGSLSTSLSTSLSSFHAEYMRHLDNLRQVSSSTPVSSQYHGVQPADCVF